MDEKIIQTLMTVVSKSMSEEEVLDKLKQSIEEYQMTKNQKAKSSLEFCLILTTTNLLTQGKNITETLEDLDKAHRGIDLLSENKS